MLSVSVSVSDCRVPVVGSAWSVVGLSLIYLSSLRLFFFRCSPHDIPPQFCAVSAYLSVSLAPCGVIVLVRRTHLRAAVRVSTPLGSASLPLWNRVVGYVKERALRGAQPIRLDGRPVGGWAESHLKSGCPVGRCKASKTFFRPNYCILTFFDYVATTRAAARKFLRPVF